LCINNLSVEVCQKRVVNKSTPSVSWCGERLTTREPITGGPVAKSLAIVLERGAHRDKRRRVGEHRRMAAACDASFPGAVAQGAPSSAATDLQSRIDDPAAVAGGKHDDRVEVELEDLGYVFGQPRNAQDHIPSCVARWRLDECGSIGLTRSDVPPAHVAHAMRPVSWGWPRSGWCGKTRTVRP